MDARKRSTTHSEESGGGMKKTIVSGFSLSVDDDVHKLINNSICMLVWEGRKGINSVQF